MATLVARFDNAGIPATGLSPLPTIQVFDADTPAAAVASGSMYEIGGGLYGFSFAPSDGVNYAWIADGGSGVTDSGERAVSGEISGTTVARQEVDIPAIRTDTETTIPATLASIEGQLTTVDAIVDAILEDTGTTIPGELTTIQGLITTVDTVVDSIKVDTGTTLVSLIAGVAGQVTVVDANVDALPALIAAVAPAVWATDITAADSALITAADMLNACRQFATNRLEAAPGNPGTQTWYQDDGTTPRFTFTLRDFDTNAVSGFVGVPALRGAAT